MMTDRMMTYDAIGVIEVRYFATALEITDAMSKTAQVELLGSEKCLGGRLVTVVVGGDVANVKAAVETAESICSGKGTNPLANTAVILKPHDEIMKFIVPAFGQNTAEAVVTETAPEASVAEAASRKTKPKKKVSRPSEAPENPKEEI